ncbi:MAG TPA: wax ester/triacylglycerol synthase domain-containing protein [Acidimicrobiales bacterium]|nr:wax ester/triacylglycerol synthase domain-containing protein [Acidimicrobiales bacterium]
MTSPAAVEQRFMRASDAFSWYMEQDPVLRSTVVAVTWLDRRPDWPTLAAKLEQASRRIPMFRRRVMDLPGRLTPPRWTDVPDFDMGWHLRRVDAADPKDDSVVMDFARREAMTGFDRAHPLWRATLIEGLTGDRAALVMTVHHSLTDGIGGMQLALMIFDGQREPSPPAESPPPLTEAAPSPLGLMTEQVGWRATRSLGFVSQRIRSVIPDLVTTARQPVRSLTSAAHEVASVARTVAPVRQTLSPLMTGRSLKRHLASMEVPLSDLKTASAKVGGSLNDGFLAAVTGGLRLYHEHHGVHVDRLRVTMPISLRTAEDLPGGNRITLMRFSVPVGEANPARRVAEIRRAAWQARHEPSLPLTDTIAGALNLLPAGVIGSMLKNVDFLASDVPGFDAPVYLAGAKVERYEAYGPTTGTAANATLLSYNGRCHIGVTVDTAAIPDPDVFMACLAQGFDEMAAMGRAAPGAAGAGGGGGDGKKPRQEVGGNIAGRSEVEQGARSESEEVDPPDEL